MYSLLSAYNIKFIERPQTYNLLSVHNIHFTERLQYKIYWASTMHSLLAPTI